jgi:TRAP-type C4-dicarboxylate transport system permease large subunit
VLSGSLPYLLCMVVAIVILCFVPEIATWLPQRMMGATITPR